MNRRTVNLEDITIVIYIFSAVVFDAGSGLMRFARLFLFLSFALKQTKRKTVRFNLYVAWLLFFLLLSSLSVLWAYDRTVSFSMVETVAVNAVCMWSLMFIIDFREKQIHTALKSIAIAPFFLEIRIIVLGGLLSGFKGVRAVGSISLNTLGLCAAFGGCCAIYLWYICSKEHCWLGLYIVNFIIVILSSSRKAILCILIPIIIVFLLNNKAAIGRIIVRTIIASVMIIIGYYAMMKVSFFYNSIGNRFESMIGIFLGHSGIVDSSTIDRLKLTSWGIAWFRKKPFLGYGIDNYRIVLHGFRPDYPLSYYAHNNYIELLVDVGIIGVIIYYWNYILVAIRALKYRKELAKEEILIFGMIIFHPLYKFVSNIQGFSVK